MRNFLNVFILVIALFYGQAFAAVKADQITTNNPTKTMVDFLKSIDIKTNDGLYLPSGTTAQRPAVPSKEGLFRYNEDSKQAEIYANGAWGAVGGGGLDKWVTGKAYKVDDVVFNGTNIYKALLDHTSGVFATDLANGDWAQLSQTDLSNYVDRTTDQTINGEKTFANKITANNNIEVAGTAKIGTLTGVLKGSSGNVTTGQVDLATEVSGQLPTANGGNFVNTTNNQVIGGNKTFNGEVRVNNYTKVNNYLDVTDDLLVQGNTNTVGETATGTLKVGSLTGFLKAATGAVTTSLVDLLTDIKSVLGFNNGGNSNLLKNATFGNVVTDEFWTCTSVNPVMQSTTGQADLNALSAHITTGGGQVTGCFQNVTLPSGLVGKYLQYSIFLNSDQASEMCATESGVTKKCVDYEASSGTKKLIFGYASQAANVGIIFRTKTTTSGNLYASKGYLGEPVSDEAIVAKFENTTGWKSVTLTTSGNQNYTITSSMQRQGDKLNLKGVITWTGAGNTTPVTIVLPNSLTANYADGTAINPVSLQKAIPDVGFGRIKNSGKEISIQMFRNFDGNSSVNTNDQYPFTPASGNFIPFYFSIPIAEWSSQTNAAIVACKEGPLKCANTYTVRISNSGTILSSNIPGWVSGCSFSGGALTCSFSGGVGVGATQPPICSANILDSGLGSAAHTSDITSVTNSGFTAKTGYFSGGGWVSTNLNISVTCTKTGEDYNEAYEKFLFPINDVVTTYSAQQVITTQNIATGGVADLDKGNIVNFIAPATTAITLNNAIDGGVYNIFFTDGTARTYTFTINKKEDGTALSVRCSPVIAATTASKHAMFTFTRIGNNAYCSWAGDL